MKTAKILARAGVTAAMYAAITILLSSFSYGIVQFRPAESLTILPMFFAESPIALFVGCGIANIFGGNAYDVILGSLISLIAGYSTRLISKKIRNPFICAIPPVLLNAIFLPFVFWLGGGKDAYLISFVSLFLSQLVSVYLIGIPLYYGLEKLRKSGNPLFDENITKKSKKDTAVTVQSTDQNN